VNEKGGPLEERLAMKAAAFAFGESGRLSLAQKLARAAQWPFKRHDQLSKLPGMLGAWTASRDLPAVPSQSFRDWWAQRARKGIRDSGFGIRD
jgi:L-lactate dehydrogenase complex protein LldF